MRLNQEQLELLATMLFANVENQLANENVSTDCSKFTNDHGFTSYTMFVIHDGIYQAQISCDDKGKQISVFGRANPRIVDIIKKAIQ